MKNKINILFNEWIDNFICETKKETMLLGCCLNIPNTLTTGKRDSINNIKFFAPRKRLKTKYLLKDSTQKQTKPRTTNVTHNNPQTQLSFFINHFSNFSIASYQTVHHPPPTTERFPVS
ncbi:hypothetical protein ACFL2V_03145 [Pseudomonadota bacterium]